jgi:hypothetical protein
MPLCNPILIVAVTTRQSANRNLVIYLFLITEKWVIASLTYSQYHHKFIKYFWWQPAHLPHSSAWDQLL